MQLHTTKGQGQLQLCHTDMPVMCHNLADACGRDFIHTTGNPKGNRIIPDRVRHANTFEVGQGLGRLTVEESLSKLTVIFL